MQKRIYFQVCVLLLMVATQLRSQPHIMEINKGWQFHKVGTNDWHSATVPGCVHTDLLTHKLISDPFYGENESKLQWIDKYSWEYRDTFTTDNATLARQNIELDFKGLDTYAEISLNGQQLLTTDNMFCEWKVDVKPYLKEGNNILSILFHSPVAMGLLSRDKFNLEAPLGYNFEFMNNEWPNVGPYTRKAAYMFGWDWGPKLTTSGIWRPVFLKAWDNARINSLQIVQKEVTLKKATITAIISVEAGKTMDAILNLSYMVHGKSTPVKPLAIKLNSGTHDYPIEVEIEKPALWWPNGLGEHPVYAFTGSLQVNNVEADKITAKSGIRTVKLIRKPETDGGTTFYFEVNGMPVFAKGANYIPSDIFPSRVSASHYKTLINAATDANMNMLRVWGGGIYESDYFYDLCDENGLMVWQDFAFAIYNMPDYPEFNESIKKELKENIERLRNHPSIVLWCGNNETELIWNALEKKFFGLPIEKESNILSDLFAFLPKSGKADSAVTDRVIKAYDEVFYKIIPEAIEKYDYNTRDYWPSSPMGDWKKPVTTKKPYSGDLHFYIAVLNLPFSAYLETQSHFFSEHGFQAWPDKKVVYQFTSPSDRKPDSPVMNAHNKALGGNNMLNKYINMYYKPAKDFDSYLYVSQVLQAEGMKLALETHRRWMPFTMGTLYWQLNDVWPVASWSSLDFQNNPKALHYFVKKAFNPLIVVPSNYKNEFKVNVVSDLRNTTEGKLEMAIVDFNGKELWKKSAQVNMPPNTSQIFYQAKTDELLKGMDTSGVVFTVKLLTGKQQLSSNLFYFAAPKNLKLVKPNITSKVTATDDGYSITLTTDKLVKNLYLSTSYDGNFSDNYFDILPGEKVTVIFKTKEKTADFEEKLTLISLVDTY